MSIRGEIRLYAKLKLTPPPQKNGNWRYFFTSLVREQPAEDCRLHFKVLDFDKGVANK